MSQTIFCSFSFPTDIQDLLTHCLVWNPLLGICKMCVCVTSPLGVHAIILSHHLCFFIDEGRAKKKYFPINFYWRLSVLGHGLGQVSLPGVGRIYVVETILDYLLKPIEEENVSYECISTHKFIYSFSWYELSAYFAVAFLDSDDIRKEKDREQDRQGSW